MNSTSDGILSNVILFLLFFAMLLQIGCAVPFISSRYGEMKIQGIEIKGKISELGSKELWAGEYEEECYKSNIDKVSKNLEIALFKKTGKKVYFWGKLNLILRVISIWVYLNSKCKVGVNGII